MYTVVCVMDASAEVGCSHNKRKVNLNQIPINGPTIKACCHTENETVEVLPAPLSPPFVFSHTHNYVGFPSLTSIW